MKRAKSTVRAVRQADPNLTRRPTDKWSAQSAPRSEGLVNENLSEGSKDARSPRWSSANHEAAHGPPKRAQAAT